MDRELVLRKIREIIKEENIVKHLLATEAVMRGIAEYFEEDVEKWGLSGLVHDIDYHLTKNAMKFHGIQGARMLKEMGFPQDIIDAVKAHNPLNGSERKTLLEKALYATDPLTGLITACALVKGKKLENVDVDFVMKRFKEKHFAAGANREMIAACTEMGLSLEDFVLIGLEKMKEIHKDLDL